MKSVANMQRYYLVYHNFLGFKISAPPARRCRPKGCDPDTLLVDNFREKVRDLKWLVFENEFQKMERYPGRLTTGIPTASGSGSHTRKKRMPTRS
jgi:hypothetical protein